jgi:phytol kinase
MIESVLLIALILSAAVLALLGSSHLGAKYGLPPEVTRKVLHFTTGAVAVTFPWLFDSFWPVAVICSAVVVMLLVVRHWRLLQKPLGGGLYDIGRESMGELLFPIAVALLFVWAGEDTLLYLIPIIVLTTADGAAALVALRYGLTPFITLDGRKSWEGAFVFFIVAFVSTLVPLLLLSDVGRAETLLICCLIGLVGCCIEAASWYGLDNILVPLGTYLILERVIGLGPVPLLKELAIVLLLITVVALWVPKTRLSIQAMFGAIVTGFIFWSVGGAAWLVPAAMFFILHPLLVKAPRQAPGHVDIRAVLSVAGTGVVWLVLYKVSILSMVESFFPFTTAFSAHLTMIAFMRRSAPPDTVVRLREHAKWSFLATIVMMSPFLLFAGINQRNLFLAVLAWPISFLASCTLGLLKVRPPTTRRWRLEASVALTFSLFALICAMTLAV